MRYRVIDTRFWSDEKVRRFSDDGRLVFLYVLSHPHMTALGAMRATVEGLAAELGWPAERLQAALAPALDQGMVIINAGAAYLELPRFLRYNEPNGPNAVRKAWPAALDLLPECFEKRALAGRCRDYLKTRTPVFQTAAGPDVVQKLDDAIGDAIHDATADAMPDAIAQRGATDGNGDPGTGTEPGPGHSPLPPSRGDRVTALEWLDLLNREGGRHFKSTDANLKPIRARLGEGYTVQQAGQVVRDRVARWKGTAQDQYLRPETVFGGKFDSYLQAAINGPRPTRARGAVNSAWGLAEAHAAGQRQQAQDGEPSS